MFVYVVNKHGRPLMPCRPRKARILLQSGKAKVIRRTPFTIQLIYGSSGYVQPVSLGVDAGSKVLGISTTTERTVLFEAEIQLRADMVNLLSTRREFRRSRRNRKTRYRQPRFLNRRRPDGWLAPSVENRIETHLKAVKLVRSILPVYKTVIEVAQFDIQKIKNPDIQGVEYQQGEELGFWNTREYVLWRDNHNCQNCHGASKDRRLNVHHIESRKTSGDAPNNLVTLCETCHNNYHTCAIKLKARRGQPFRDAAFMGVMRWAFYNKLKAEYSGVSMTYGYLTKTGRISAGLPKTHGVDARCISGNPLAKPDDTLYIVKQVRMQNRQLHKATIGKGGVRRENKAAKYVHNFRLFDKVMYDDRECFVFGRRSSGYFNLRLLDGTKVHASASVKKLRLLERAKSLLIERRVGDFLPSLKKRYPSPDIL